ncbi:glucose transporter type 1 [Anastrepha obliqua]|uniref:glucose transporter type 1 n=1 Tax=Anastrepha obliqua TaxID=95512 RepID=UPI002409529B|nr:glucose transporter type 1 [Anastrepha obliqua]
MSWRRRSNTAPTAARGLTFFLTYSIFSAVLGMLQFGYNTGVINAPERNIENFMKDVYKDRYGEDISEEFIQQLYSVAVSIFAIGGMLGGFSGGWMANRFGRKGGLLLNNVLGISGACLMGFTKVSHSYEMLFLGRFIIGVNCGLNTSLVPMYISEIAPLNLRGGLGTVNQLAVTIGLLLSQVLGIEQILGTNEGWPVLLGLAICPAILQLILLPVCPESPRYLLITKQWEEEARRALRRLRASSSVEEDIEEMRAEERAQQSESHMSTMELICSPTLRPPLIIGIVMQLSQQFSGINAVLYYSTSLFMSSGLTDESAKFSTIGIGAIMVLMTLIAIPLMDRTGRRTLQLYGLGGMFIFSIFITISFLIKEMIDWMSYLSVVSTLGFVVFFAVGPGSIPWMITAELFSQGPRPSAMAIAVLVNWMANFVVGIGFQSMRTELENYTFLPFSVFLAIFWIFTYKKVPETKNKTFEEICALFRHGNGSDHDSSYRQSDSTADIEIQHRNSGDERSKEKWSMLNCTNSLEPQSMNSGIEHAALMVSEEKTQHDSRMGPYPLSDSTNLLGPTTSLAGSSTCYTNYGTNIHTPMPVRKCHYEYAYDRDSFRRHSAHGRMNASPPETASVHSTNAEQHQYQHLQHHQHQQQQQQPQQQSKHSRQQQQQQQTQQHHHVHCSYDKDIVCDDTQAHLQQLQQQQQQHGDQSHMHQPTHCHSHIAYAEPLQQSSSTPTPHRHQQQRKHSHSHSPHHSRHTSPHSHHSHSQHSSPHQSHHHMHESDSLTRSSLTHPPRPSANTQSSSSHQHHHHNHRRRRSRHSYQQYNAGENRNAVDAGGSANSSLHGAHGHSQQGEQRSSSRHHGHTHSSSCTKRHRSATDISSTSLNTCHDPACVDREVQDILVRKTCCNSSRTELAQYFAEDLYGSTRRPSSCCTSSDYCYQTDSTSLYGSRSSLSRNNSIKSASVALRKRRLHQRQPSYTSISLRGLSTGRISSHPGSLTSVFDRAKQMGIDAADLEKRGSGGKMVVSPSKVTIERQTSKDALSNDLPGYACSPSPIRWSFLADGKSPTELDRSGEGDSKDPWASADEQTREPKQPKCEHRSDHRSYTMQHTSRKYSHDDRPSTSAAAARKCRESPFNCDFEESSTTVLFHQEADSFNNCCNNYIQCNTYLDQDLQITSEDIHQYLSKGNQQSSDVLNNSKNYPFQPSNALEFQYKNNFANNNTGAASSEGGDSVRGFEVCFRRNSSKETNLNQNSAAGGASVASQDAERPECAASSYSSTPLSPTNINLSSSTNNINIVFGNYTERNANEVKFINTTRGGDGVAVSTEAHHSGYLPYTYPSYDYTNMSANSLFDKPLGIGELPKDFTRTAGSAAEVEDGAVGGCIGTSCGSPTVTATSEEQHSSLLQSPVLTGVSFESFDAASDHNLISCRGSCQFSPTPLSPLSPASPASSVCLSASINPAAASYVNTHHPHFHYQPHEDDRQHSPNRARRHYHHHAQYHHHHFTESFKISNALKKVRKRARKYTDFLRKK